MKCIFLLASFLWGYQLFAQLEGRITSSIDNQPLTGATVKLMGTGYASQSDDSGLFSLPMPSGNDTLYIHYLGYISRFIPVDASTEFPMDITLEPDENMLDEVEVNTGFYQVPRERATGSFTHVDNKTLNRVVGGNILQRLEGVASGVQFTQANGTSASAIRVRGLATIESSAEPLIVVDNFPYEGDINTINPNDIESVTVLKDAAAASIWGARAGNGVIVITTKRGRYNQRAQISVNSNVTIGEKPDLFYSQNRLPSEIVMQIEKDKYERGGYYVESPQQTPFPEYVELLIARDSGWISEADFLAKEALLQNTEVRDEALKYLYQPSIYQQYALNVRGGGEAHTYYLSAGYDNNRSNIIGNGNNRLNLNLQNTFRPLKGMELSAAVWYTQQEGESNGLSLGDLAARATQVGLSPYMRLKDEQGNNLPIVKDYRLPYVGTAEQDGLLDWQYRPLDEVALADNRTQGTEMRLNGGLRYSFLNHFDVNATYQYVRSRSESSSLYHEDSYFARDMVNRFTQEDGSLVIPHAPIFSAGNPVEAVSHSGRAQLNYNQSFNDNHVVSALVGGEVRQFLQNTYPGYTLYNYDDDLLTGTMQYDYTRFYQTRPQSSSTIPVPSNVRQRFIDRYLSYFGNASYTYKDRYLFSASARWDGSNLFGVKTNQKGTPLWSVGASWEVSKESFYRMNWLPYLRVRATYGSSGNVNKNVSAFPTIIHAGPDRTSGLNRGLVRSAGNPSLRWEEVNTLNLALDFAAVSRRISGSFDYYIKNAKDLIGTDYLAPSTGIITGGTAINTNLINYANLCTYGMDVQLTTKNLIKPVQWNTTFLFNYVKNKVTRFNTSETNQVYHYTGSPSVPVKGKSRDVIYAFPWNGLDDQTGLPIIYVDGMVSSDYDTYYSTNNLIGVGVRVPPYYGSLRNEVVWKDVSLSVLVSWKAGYKFRRNSSIPGSEYISALNYHRDYLNRWQAPGDELKTYVPVHPGPGVNGYIASIYEDSQVLVVSGSHIRLQDVVLSYSLPVGWSLFRQVRFYAYARNLGVLWCANNNDIDPDYPAGEYIVPRTIAFGLELNF